MLFIYSNCPFQLQAVNYTNASNVFRFFKYILFPTIPTINQKININKLRFQGHLNLRFFTKGIGIWQPEYRNNVIYF